MDPEFATWGNSLKHEHARAKEVMVREGRHLAAKFEFVEVSSYTMGDLQKVIKVMGAVPPKNGMSGFIAVWRDGAARLYTGQPQSEFLANWLLTLETSLLVRHLNTKALRKAFQTQENVRVVGYFKQAGEGATDFQFTLFERVAKRYHLDIEFAAVTDRASAKFFKLMNFGDIAILKPMETHIWSRDARDFYEILRKSGESPESDRLQDKKDPKKAQGDDEEDDEEEEIEVPEWTRSDLDQWIRLHQKPFWAEIQVASLFQYWFSPLPKVLIVGKDKQAFSRHHTTSVAFSNFKTLSKQYSRDAGMEFLSLDAQVFSQIPPSIKVTPEELPAMVAFIDARHLGDNVLKINPEDSPSEMLQNMKNFLDKYIADNTNVDEAASAENGDLKNEESKNEGKEAKNEDKEEL